MFFFLERSRPIWCWWRTFSWWSASVSSVKKKHFFRRSSLKKKNFFLSWKNSPVSQSHGVWRHDGRQLSDVVRAGLCRSRRSRYVVLFSFSKNFQVYLDGLWWALMGFGGLWWALMGFGGFWWVLMGSDGFWWGLVGFDGVLMGFDGFWWALMGFGGFWWGLMGLLLRWSMSRSRQWRFGVPSERNHQRGQSSRTFDRNFRKYRRFLSHCPLWLFLLRCLNRCAGKNKEMVLFCFVDFLESEEVGIWRNRIGNHVVTRRGSACLRRNRGQIENATSPCPFFNYFFCDFSVGPCVVFKYFRVA